MVVEHKKKVEQITQYEAIHKTSSCETKKRHIQPPKPKPEEKFPKGKKD
jgi:hypothetical protein